MCLKHRSAAKSTPLARVVDSFRANTSDRTKSPYINPLYWKCIWSIIKRPGERSMERAAAWDGRLSAGGADFTKLQQTSVQFSKLSERLLQVQCIDKNKLSYYDSSPLEIHSLPALILQVVNPQHSWIYQLCELGQDPFEIGKEGWVVECPFRSFLVVPFFDRQAVCDGQPIPMNFEIRGFATGQLAFDSC